MIKVQSGAFFFVDCLPTDDFEFIKTREVDRISNGGFITAFCSLCPAPARNVIFWQPKTPDERGAAKVPMGLERIIFYPVCDFCTQKPNVVQEVKWKSTESLHCNIPLTEVGFEYHH